MSKSAGVGISDECSNETADRTSNIKIVCFVPNAVGNS